MISHNAHNPACNLYRRISTYKSAYSVCVADDDADTRSWAVNTNGFPVPNSIIFGSDAKMVNERMLQ